MNRITLVRNVLSREVIEASIITNLDAEMVSNLRNRSEGEYRKEGGAPYTCLECGEPVYIHKKSLKKVGHFKHHPAKDGTPSCPLRSDETFVRPSEIYNGEGRLHLWWKTQIALALCRTGVEDLEIEQAQTSDKNSLRPDIKFKFKGKSYAIEVQASWQSPLKIQNRESYYLKNDVILIWPVLEGTGKLMQDLKFNPNSNGFLCPLIRGCEKEWGNGFSLPRATSFFEYGANGPNTPLECVETVKYEYVSLQEVADSIKECDGEYMYPAKCSIQDVQHQFYLNRLKALQRFMWGGSFQDRSSGLVKRYLGNRQGIHGDALDLFELLTGIALGDALFSETDFGFDVLSQHRHPEWATYAFMVALAYLDPDQQSRYSDLMSVAMEQSDFDYDSPAFDLSDTGLQLVLYWFPLVEYQFKDSDNSDLVEFRGGLKD